MTNWCVQCGGSGRAWYRKPRWWLWRRGYCGACGGDGVAKPPGWPDPVKMKRIRELLARRAARRPPPPQGSGRPS